MEEGHLAVPFFLLRPYIWQELVKRLALAMPQPSAQAREDAQAFMQRVAAIEIGRCPHCQAGRWQLLHECSADRQAITALLSITCRGQP